MAKISKVQFANEEETLHFVLYSDNTHKYLYLNDESMEGSQLRSWLRNGNTVEEFVPVIEGGIIPIAAIMWFCSSRVPDGYLLCDGSAVSRAQYANLFREIGEIYGSGDGATTFNLPDLEGRFCRGWGPVSPLDPARTFGSYQEDNVGIHAHGLQPITHTHLITDPSHGHGVTDPGHSHPMTDSGHLHTVTDPGHQHTWTAFSHVGFAGSYNIFNNGAVQFGSGGFFYGSYDFFIQNNAANMVVTPAKANLQLQTSLSNVVDGPTVTNISIDTAGVNIPFTEMGGDLETRPDNVALLPVIRY